MTDVNIAVKILGDAGDDRFDTAVIVSGDSDLTGPIEEVRARYPNKRVVVAFPPNRHPTGLKKGGGRALRHSQKRAPGQPVSRYGRQARRLPAVAPG